MQLHERQYVAQWDMGIPEDRDSVREPCKGEEREREREKRVREEKKREAMCAMRDECEDALVTLGALKPSLHSRVRDEKQRVRER